MPRVCREGRMRLNNTTWKILFFKLIVCLFFTIYLKEHQYIHQQIYSLLRKQPTQHTQRIVFLTFIKNMLEIGWGGGALFVLHAKIPLAVRYLSVCIFHAQFLNISVGFKLKLTRSSHIFFDWICSYANADEKLTCNSLIEKKFFLAFVTCRLRESKRVQKLFFKKMYIGKILENKA